MLVYAWMQRWIGAFAILALMASAARADSPKQVFERYNQIGTFAWDCSKPASKDNPYYVNRVLGENVQRDQMSGPTTRDSVAIIEQASALGPNELSLSGTRDGEPTEASSVSVLSFVAPL